MFALWKLFSDAYPKVHKPMKNATHPAKHRFLTLHTGKLIKTPSLKGNGTYGPWFHRSKIEGICHPSIPQNQTAFLKRALHNHFERP
jgi:hypothetical protein